MHKRLDWISENRFQELERISVLWNRLVHKIWVNCTVLCSGSRIDLAGCQSRQRLPRTPERRSRSGCQGRQLSQNFNFYHIHLRVICRRFYEAEQQFRNILKRVTSRAMYKCVPFAMFCVQSGFPFDSGIYGWKWTRCWSDSVRSHASQSSRNVPNVSTTKYVPMPSHID